MEHTCDTDQTVGFQLSCIMMNSAVRPVSVCLSVASRCYIETAEWTELVSIEHRHVTTRKPSLEVAPATFSCDREL